MTDSDLLIKCVAAISYGLCSQQVIPIQKYFELVCLRYPELKHRPDIFQKAVATCRAELVITGFKNGYAFQTLSLAKRQKQLTMVEMDNIMSVKSIDRQNPL